MPENGNGAVKKAVIWVVGVLVAAALTGVIAWIGTETLSSAKAIPLIEDRLVSAEKHDVTDDMAIEKISTAVGEIQDSLLLLTFKMNLMVVELADIDAKLETTLTWQRTTAETLNRMMGRMNFDDYGLRPDSNTQWGMFFIPSPP